MGKEAGHGSEGSEGQKSKDIWDKLDVMGKILSAVVLAVVALVIKTGTDNIATSMKKGDFVKNLISDLAVPSEKVRRDIALIALDHALSQEEDSGLVSAIAERVLLTNQETETRTGEVAYKILERSNKDAAKCIREDADRVLEARNYKNNKSSAEPNRSSTATEAAQPLPTFVSGVFSNVVYVQYKNRENKEIAENIRTLLQKKGLKAPGVELVEANYHNTVRYFHPEDLGVATTVAQLVNGAMEGQSNKVRFTVELVPATKFKSPKGQVEVWMAMR